MAGSLLDGVLKTQRKCRVLERALFIEVFFKTLGAEGRGVLYRLGSVRGQVLAMDDRELLYGFLVAKH